MDGLAGSQLAGVWRVVEQLDDMNREVGRLLRDLRRLQGAATTRELALAATDMETTASDLHRSLSSSAGRDKVGTYLAVLRQQSKETSDAVFAIASDLPAAQRLVRAHHERLLAAMNELPHDVLPPRTLAEEPPFVDDLLQFSTQRGSTEVDETRIRALLARRGTVLIVDGDQVALQGWPDLSVLKRRDSLLSLLSLVRDRADIDVVLDCRVGGREAAAIADGVRVLLTSPNAVPADAVQFLVGAQSFGTPILVVTDDRDLASRVAQMEQAALSASSVSLLRLLVDI